VVILAYGAEPHLEKCIDAVLASKGVDVDVVLVDNGCPRLEAIAELGDRREVTLVRPQTNLGFAGGCNAGAAQSRGDVLVFVNSDAIVAADAIQQLGDAVCRPEVGLATASIRLAEDPALLNSAGNPWHLSGVVWSGHFGEPAAEYEVATAVATASGAAFAIRRQVWDALGGFDNTWFAYNEDADLSIRAWQRGWSVVYVPEAVVVHHYEFSRNPRKSYLLERNRLLNVLTLYEARTLFLLAPVLVAFELGVLIVASRQGWLREKLDGYVWLFRHPGWLRSRRRAVQACRVVPDRELRQLFTSRFDPSNIEAPAGVTALNVAVDRYWRAVRNFV